MKSELLLTEGSIKSKILRFAFPIFLGNLFQQFYNIIDAIVVGNFLGKNALAAVSSTGSLIFLLIGFYGGMFTGVSVVISRFFGSKDEKMVKKSVGTAVSFGLISGVILTLVGVIFTPYILKLMGTPTEVFKDSSNYIRTYFCGSLFVVMYNTANGIFQAVGDSKRPLYYLMISSVLNVILDIFFVTVIKLGVFGVAIATVISQGVSAFVAYYRLWHIKDVYSVNFKTICIDKKLLKEMIGIGLPSGLQNSIIAFANVFVQSSINVFGAAAMAGNGSYSKIEGFAFIPITAFTMSITTFVSQNIGAKRFDRVKAGAKFAITFSCILAEIVGIIFIIFAPQLISIFGNESGVIDYGVRRVYIDAIFYFLLSFSHCIASLLRGAGISKVPMFVMLICWCIIRVSYIKLFTFLFHNIIVVYWAYPLTWFLSSCFFLVYYKKSKFLEKIENRYS